MADSGFWQELAAEFRALQATHGEFRADYQYTLGSGVGEWKLQGAGRTARIEFEKLAIRGASQLPNQGASALHAWLEALRFAGGNCDFKLVGIEQNADGSDGAEHYADTIPRICEASADLCRELEIRALEAHYLEKQQNNPKSRSHLGAATPADEPDRVKMVDEFLLQCNLESGAGLKVIRKHISLAAGHAHPRQFQYWQNRSDKATAEDDRNFRRILSMRPAEFVVLLRKKGILLPGF